MSGKSREDLLREQVRLVFEHLPTMQSASFLVALVLSYVVRDIVSPGRIIAWILMILVIVLSRILLYYRFIKVSEGPFDGEYWKSAYLRLAFISGVLWGLSAFVIFPAGNFMLISLFVLVIASLSAATTISHSSIKLAPAAWASPALLLYAVRCVLERGETGYTIGLLILIYLATIVRYSFTQHRATGSAIALKFENLELLAELQRLNESLSQDITLHKRTEETLRKYYELLADHSRDIILFVRCDNGRILEANAAARKAYGYSHEELLELSIQDLRALDTRSLTPAQMAEADARGILFSTLHQRKDGSSFPVEVSSRGVTIHGTRTLISVVRDITERKEAEEKHRRLAQRLFQAQKAESLGRMAGAIAHHFNSLLGAVMGRLELALGDPHEASRPQHHLAEAMKASQRAAEISRLMLTYLGHTAQPKGPCDLTEIVREALLLLEPSLPPGVHLKTELPPEALIIKGDKAGIEQVLTHLVLNAAEAIDKGDGQITVAVHAMAAEELRRFHFFPSDWKPTEDRYVSMSIADTGSGFDLATKERIFDPFFSTKFMGRGMGLPVTLGVLKAHGGGLAVESQPGRGALFQVFLPLLRERTLPADEETAVAFDPLEGKGLVLLVADEPAVCDVAKEMLKGFGYEVVAAGDGQGALERFREYQDKVCLLLLDQSTPGRSGWQTLAALRALRPDLPVIFARSDDEAQVIRGDQKEQPLVFLHKPYQMKHLAAALRAAQRSPNAHGG